MHFFRPRARLLVLLVLLVVVGAGCAGTQLWVSRYNGPGNAARVAVSGNGDRVFLSGTSFGSGDSGSISTVAYDAADGRDLWADVYLDTYAEDLAVSPDGSRVFVTGLFVGGGSADYVTIAYGAASGQRLWVSRYNATGDGTSVPQSLALSPDGTRLFVTGYSTDSHATVYAYTTVAYDTSNGVRLWANASNGSGGNSSSGNSQSVGVSPDGAKVYVTGGLDNDFGTIAYNAATGTQLWISRYTRAFGAAIRLFVSPDGSKVFVAGSSIHAPTDVNDYATVAYNATNGAQLWVSRYNGPANGDDSVHDLALSVDGTKLFVTGSSEYDTSQFPAPTSAATVAYNATNGAQLWVSRYGPANGDASAQGVAVSPDGTKIFVTGSADGNYATVAYNATNGAQGWSALYNGAATSIVVSPSATKLFVTGISGSDFATIAYSLS